MVGFGCCCKVLGAGAVLAVPAAVLWQYVSGTATMFNNAPAATGVYHYAALAVRNNWDISKHATPIFRDFVPDALTCSRYVLLSLLGSFHLMHRSLLPADWSAWRYPADKEGTFCRDLLGYMWVSPNVSGLSYPAVYADHEDVLEWVKRCRLAFAELGPEERSLLEPFVEAGVIPREALIPSLEDHAAILRTSRASGRPVLEDGGRKLSRDEVLQTLRRSIAASSWAGTVAEPPQGMLDYLTTLDLREPVRISSTWKDVGAAVRAGKVTTFDAAALLPKELINVSVAQLASWEGASASQIPVWHDGCKASPLDKFAAAREAFVTRGAAAKENWNAAWEKVTVAKGALVLDEQTLQKVSEPVAPELGPNSAPCRTGYVHTRRLPNFHAKLPDIEGPMGIEEDTLRSQSMLWLGSTPGGFHFDEEANVYVQLSGESFAFLVPQNFTDVMTGSERHPWGSSGLPAREEIAADPFLKEIPIYFVHLKPGDGITLQGRAYHRFMAQTQDRVSLNWFFIPRWRRMEYTPADWYSKEAKRSLPRLALRQLWARTLAKLFDETGRGVIFMGGKLEYL